MSKEKVHIFPSKYFLMHGSTRMECTSIYVWSSVLYYSFVDSVQFVFVDIN